MEIRIKPEQLERLKREGRSLREVLAEQQASLAPEEINQNNPVTILESGHARCVTEPRGANGLEGYVLGQFYQFERCEGEKGRYCRVYPDRSLPGYYETCGECVFAGCFELVVFRERGADG